jgi:hypothetical protein
MRSSAPSKTPLSQASGEQRARDAGHAAPDTQSPALRQLCPTSQRAAQAPPQSTSDSSPFATPSLQLAAAQQPATQMNAGQSLFASQRPSTHAGPASARLQGGAAGQSLPTQSASSSSHDAAPAHAASGVEGAAAAPVSSGGAGATRFGSNSSVESVHAPPDATASTTITGQGLRCRRHDM